MAIVPTLTIHYARLASRADASPSSECTAAVPGKYGRVDDYSACNAYYTYNPCFAAAILFSVLFGILTVSHTTQAFWYKKRFTWVVITGVLFELTSFVCRTLVSRDQQNVGLATARINAFHFMTFGRLVHFVHPDRRSAGRCRWFDAQKIGLKVYMAGIGVQDGFIIVFTVLGVKFVRDLLQVEARGRMPSNKTGWRLQMWIMFTVLVFITVRIIFRLVEFTKGFEPGNLMLFDEAYIYCLDASPMLLALLLLSVMHPGRVLVGSESEFPRPSRKEKKLMEQQEKEEKCSSKNRLHAYIELAVAERV
ncbi:hypothetical protein E8E12_006798 [Didymella heteroderae]|uniref:Uncharacterized protein n=1 Tax=Didymella heteroderae TaxID=1769908 RepID=A0A9P4WLV8_9PLEO|nr:hypothetical protein E8E12_006798 [Didymella heteroderae]